MGSINKLNWRHIAKCRFFCCHMHKKWSKCTVTIILLLLCAWQIAYVIPESYYLLGFVVQGPFENRVDYLLRAMKYIGYKEAYATEDFSPYSEQLRSLPWNKVGNKVVSQYIETPLLNQLNLKPIQIAKWWPNESRQLCETMLSDDYSISLHKKEKTIYLLIDICTLTGDHDMAEQYTNILNKILEAYDFSDVPLGHDMDIMRREFGYW